MYKRERKRESNVNNYTVWYHGFPATVATVVFAQATFFTQLSYLHPLFLTISPTVVSRWIFGRLLYKTRIGTSLSFWGKVYRAPVFPVAKYERGKCSQRGVSRPCRRHHNDGSYAWLPPVMMKCRDMSPSSPGTPPPVQPSNVTVITSTNVVAGPVTYRESPVRTTCPFCHQEIITNTDRVTGLVTWLAAGGLCLLGWVLRSQYVEGQRSQYVEGQTF